MTDPVEQPYPSEEWLRDMNRKFRAANLPTRQRPYEAWRLLEVETGVVLGLSSPAVVRILDWFRSNTKAGSDTVGPMFEGAYFYDACFWPLVVPVSWGTHRLEAARALRGMPPPILADLLSDASAVEDLARCFRDTLDYVMGADTVLSTESSHFATEFLYSGDRQIRSAAHALTRSRPTAEAGQSATLGLEMIAKWFLCARGGWSKKEAEDQGHHVRKLLTACQDHLTPCALDDFSAQIEQLSPIGARYSSHEPAASQLWAQYRAAVGIGAVLLRSAARSEGSNSARTPSPLG